MQSYLNVWETAFLTLEIGYFLLCIISQFKSLSVAVILSTFINLGLLFLLQQAFQLQENFPTNTHVAVIGFILFAVFSLAILSTDHKENKNRSKVATKIPFLGLAIGFYLPSPYQTIALILGTLILGQFLFHHRDRYRLYFRTYLFTVSFIVLFFVSFLSPWLKLLGLFSLFFVIMYLNQLLNLIMVKAYLQKELAIQVQE